VHQVLAIRISSRMPGPRCRSQLCCLSACTELWLHSKISTTGHILASPTILHHLRHTSGTVHTLQHHLHLFIRQQVQSCGWPLSASCPG
jgi:hypothetical protein